MTNDGPAELVAKGIAGQLADLDARIASANSPGNLDGLFAHHVLRSSTSVPFGWEVSPFVGDWLERNSGLAMTAPQLAVLGYGITEFGNHSSGAAAQLTTGLGHLMRRDPDPPDRVTFLRDPRQLIGITLAAITVRADHPEFASWLEHTFAHARPGVDSHHELVLRHASSILTGAAPVTVSVTGTDASSLALLHLMTSAGTARLPDPSTDLRELQKQIIIGLMHTRAADLAVPQAALLRAAAAHIIEATIDSAVLNRSHVGVVLRRFPAAMKRWRWDDPNEIKHPIQWPITSEREVQDIVWALLRAVFDDLVDEEPLRKVGHSSHRSDFGLPRLGVLIEVKYVRAATDFKKVEREIYEDAATYLRDRTTYRNLVVFIYDASASVQEHATTISALLENENIIDVVIVSRPSQLPGPAVPSKNHSQAREGTSCPSTETSSSTSNSAQRSKIMGREPGS